LQKQKDGAWESARRFETSMSTWDRSVENDIDFWLAWRALINLNGAINAQTRPIRIAMPAKPRVPSVFLHMPIGRTFRYMNAPSIYYNQIKTCIP
jgi:hypothetical protein